MSSDEGPVGPAPRWQRRLWAWGPALAVVGAFCGAMALGARGPWWVLAAALSGAAYAIRARRPGVSVALTSVVVVSAGLPGVDVLGELFDVRYLLLLAVPLLPLAELASRARPRVSVPGLVVAAGAAVAVSPEPLWDGGSRSAGSVVVSVVLNLGVPVLVVGAAWLAGYALRARQRTLDALLAEAALRERAREADAARAVHEERARIGRDLHDLVTHTVAVMVVQAAAADAVWETSPERAREAVRAVETSGRTAMADLRALLGTMLEDDAGSAPRRAQPGLEQLEELAAGVRAAGLDARLSVRGDRAAVAAPVAVSLLRIAQESVTNALRHAQARSVAIALVVGPGSVDLSIADDGIGPRTARPGNALDPAGDGGRGVRGMRERARSIGGTLTVSPGPTGGTVVAVRAPTATATEAIR